MKSLRPFSYSKILTVLFLTLILIISFYGKVSAQDETPNYDTVTVEDPIYDNAIAGEFTPGKGFTIIKTGLGSLNISLYGLARYVNQIDNDNKYIDHLGREKSIDPRQDVGWHRTMVWFSGYFYTSKLRYNITVWGLASTDQTLVFRIPVILMEGRTWNRNWYRAKSWLSFYARSLAVYAIE
ncbi:MAG: hypothetical protein MZV64_08980 [Ignavibacteriales bacterium]|nr:hypothetical protein [Ignavibacteriales bacterium]